MKKFLGFLLGLFLVVGIVSSSSANSFSDTEDIWKWLGGTGSFSWTHDTPADLEVPYDTVSSATIEIFAYYVDDKNDQIDVQGVVTGTLSDAYYWGWELQGTLLNVAPVFVSWTNGDDLNVTLNYDEGWGALYLKWSEFNICYENGSAPVPEPATMMLLGLGLLGLAGVSRKKA